MLDIDEVLESGESDDFTEDKQQDFSKDRAPSSKAVDNNLVKKIWLGEFSLPMSFWVFGTVIPTLLFNLPIAMLFLTESYGEFLYILLTAYAVYIVIAYVGVWRSASNYKGFKLWRVLAYVTVIVTFLSMPLYIVSGYISANSILENSSSGMESLTSVAPGDELVVQAVFEEFPEIHDLLFVISSDVTIL
ncbi:MAG: hypothetical protein U9R28_11225, partial [Pseudomonadota bacterium]|nr:hypothetical protein [Pseudomonadota bacterium]